MSGMRNPVVFGSFQGSPSVIFCFLSDCIVSDIDIL